MDQLTFGLKHSKELKSNGQDKHNEDRKPKVPRLSHFEGFEQEICVVPIVERKVHDHHLDLTAIFETIFNQSLER
jgi:hypothetical protein